MNAVFEFLLIIFAAIVFENAVVTRGLGSSKEILMFSSIRGILRYGAFLTVYLFFSALLSWPIYQALRGYNPGQRMGTRYLYSATTLLCTFLVFIAMFYVTRFFFPRVHYYLRKMRVWLLFNCAVLGTILIAFSSGDTLLRTLGMPSGSGGAGYAPLLQTLGFSIGSGIGYTLALVIVREGRIRLSLANIPKAFRGLPVTLLYLGIFSLSIYGLIGHALPT